MSDPTRTALKRKAMNASPEKSPQSEYRSIAETPLRFSLQMAKTLYISEMHVHFRNVRRIIKNVL